jgi:hypothetical protein
MQQEAAAGRKRRGPDGPLSITDASEMTAFSGICLVMTYNRLPELEDYWLRDPNLGIDIIRATMPFRRFKEIRERELHFALLIFRTWKIKPFSIK